MAEVKTILCPICHKENLRRARFCQHCGHDIVLNNDGPGNDRQYYITRVIKQGGQGSVYEGIGDDGKIYAIKEMLDRFTDPREREESITRFDAEANMLQGLTHPRIPRVYSHFKDEGRHYLTMDFVRGEDLEDVLEREGPLPEGQLLEWADQICDVLGYLHARGLVYRDMKPSNVMIDRANGGVKLIDFGIAKLFKPTERGTQIGTPGYAPPEQYQGIATPASDIYALGATLHHLLTGRDPADEAPFSYPPARNLKPSISRRTSDALEKALQMKPEDRFGSVAEMRALLRPISTQPQLQVRVTPPTTVLPSQPQRVAPGPPALVPSMAPPTPQASVAPTAPPAPRPRTTPGPAPVAAAKPRRGGFGRWLVFLLLLGTIGGGAYTYINNPELIAPYLTQIEQLVPQPTPTTVPLISRSYETEVSVELVASADDAGIRTALRDAYIRKAQAELGPATRINANAPPALIGPYEKLSEVNGVVTYRATMSGRVLVPQ